MYICKYHNKPPCITIISSPKCSFLVNKGQEGKTGPFWGRMSYQWERGGQKERVKEGKYGGSILHSCMKTEQ
jgi:hypothetical protein